MRGIFIVLEGGDRSGKSTQCNLAICALRKIGHKVEGISFPNRNTPSGKLIEQCLNQNSLIDDRALHLLFSANRWELSQYIWDTLKSGVSIVCDRYIYSGIAFTAAKGYDLKWCCAPEIGLPAPDLILFMDLSVEISADRLSFGREIYETISFQKKVRDTYQRICGADWRIINSSNSIEKIHDECMRSIHNSLCVVDLTSNPSTFNGIDNTTCKMP